MERTLIAVGASALLGACLHAARSLPPAPLPVVARPAAPSSTAGPPSEIEPAWPESLAAALGSHGNPHAQPIALPPDPRGGQRWLAFVGPRAAALGAWRVARTSDGAFKTDPVERWPTAVKVVGALVHDGVAYVLLETLAALDQPAGLRAAWIESAGRPSPLEASPMALAEVPNMDDLASRVTKRLPVASSERNAAALLATLRAASASTAALAQSLSIGGADIYTAWQSLFAQRVGHLDRDSAHGSPLAAHALVIVREALATQACGADACESWSERGRAVVRFAVEGGRWVLRAVIEDAPTARGAPGAYAPKDVPRAPNTAATEAVLRIRARGAKELLGEASLSSAPDSGTIGVALTEGAPEVPVVVLREGMAFRLFPIDAGAVRAVAIQSRWDVAFADVDGDGRTDVLVQIRGQHADGGPLVWTQTFLAPPPSVQASSVEADLPSALAVMDAADPSAAARAAVALPLRGVPRDDACRLLSAATTPAGFRKVASASARLLLFSEPDMPTWRPKVIPLAKLAAEDVRGLVVNCQELSCANARPYCVWTSGADSTHVWFAWHESKLEIAAAADYQGE